MQPTLLCPSSVFGVGGGGGVLVGGIDQLVTLVGYGQSRLSQTLGRSWWRTHDDADDDR